ncbi:MAG: hypothetical protein KA436_09710 [Oligoflexales bacterium]|nr:hypothetical protein [Oligoflexales bacterium]
MKTLEPKNRREWGRWLLKTAGAGLFFRQLTLPFFLSSCKKDVKPEKDGLQLGAQAPLPTAKQVESKKILSIKPGSQVLSESSEPSSTNLCRLDLEPLIQIDKLARASEDLEPECFLYVEESQSFFAFHLPKYQHGYLTEYYLTDEGGRLLVGKSVQGHVDVSKTKKLKVQYYSDLAELRGQKICFIYKVHGKYYQYRLESPLESKVLFREKKVRTLPPSQIPSLSFDYDFSDNDLESLNKNDPGQNIGSSSGWLYQKNPNLSGFILTDMVGRVLAEDGSGYTDFLEHSMMIAYRGLANDYERCFLRVY